ncbi:hypothetical protein MNBD_GAMMA04-2314 [hydrothermal vent metagenome]|uniref:Uncharacterized protein n=1 Tax=hydrothermal vent metagenome TaxID=652676 RepID=A0A3B0VR60_9ZZZZ
MSNKTIFKWLKSPFSAYQVTIQSLLVSCFLIFSPPSFAEPQVYPDNPELQIHIDLLEIALLTDAYNKRCRGMSISQSFNQVNRLYVTKYNLTANNFIKTYIDTNVKALKSERQHRFNKMLNVLEGCRAIKTNGSIKLLKKHFRTQYEMAEKSTWYPE